MNSNNSIKGLLKDKSKEVEQIVNNAPTPIKILTAILAFFLTIFFTNYKFNFFMSVSMALITLLSLATINRIIAISFGFIYGYYMYQFLTKKEKTYGKVFEDTAIEKNGIPLIGSKTSKIIESKDIAKPTLSNNISYQFWMYINGMELIKDNDNYKNTWENYRFGQWKSVFYRGDPLNEITETSTDEERQTAINQIETIQQYPGVWLAPKLNNLSFVFNNGSGSTLERIELADVPMNEWFCVNILIEGYSVAIYLNGELVNSMLLNQVFPSDINDKNIYIGMDNVLNQCTTNCTSGTKGGWPGFLGEMIFYPYILTNKEIIESYNYYKKIIDGYQKAVVDKITYNYPALLSKKDIIQDTPYNLKDSAQKTMDNLNTTYFQF